MCSVFCSVFKFLALEFSLTCRETGWVVSAVISGGQVHGLLLSPVEGNKFKPGLKSSTQAEVTCRGIF